MKLIDIVSLPLNLAINFLKGLFNFGDPDVPFKLSDFLFGPEGIISKAIQAIKNTEIVEELNLPPVKIHCSRSTHSAIVMK